MTRLEEICEVCHKYNLKNILEIAYLLHELNIK